MYKGYDKLLIILIRKGKSETAVVQTILYAFQHSN